MKKRYGYKEVTREFFDKAYEYLLETEGVNRRPSWDDTTCSILWDDVFGNPALEIREVSRGKVKWFIKNSYMKHVFNDGFSKGVL